MKKEDHNKLIVVLGMHRSGTSVMARGMRVLGVHLGNNLMPATQDNPTGYWEDLDINALNIEMLNSLKNDWHFLTPIQSEDLDVLRRSGYFLRALEIIRKKMAAAPVFGFKDPRVAKLLPFWKEVFAYDQLNTHYILTVRHPLSVCKSLAKRDGFEFEKGYLLWLEHVINSFANTEGESHVVVDYDRLMRSPDIELARIAQEFQLQIDDSELEKFKLEFLDDELRHTVYKINDLTFDEAAPPLIQEVYSKALEIAEDKLRVEDAKFKKSIGQWGTELARQKSAFVLADKLETRIVKYEKSLQALAAQVEEKEQTLQSFSDQAIKMDETIKVLTSQVADKELSVQALTSQVVKHYHTLDALKAQMEQFQVTSQVQLAEKDARLQEIVQSRVWRLALLFRRIRVLAAPPNSRRARLLRQLVNIFISPIKKIRINQKYREDFPLIRSSDLYDETWYLTQYADVARSKMDPLFHYLLIGGFEGRDPGPNFSSTGYFDAYEDVKMARMNPLVHYFKYGRSEGRAIQTAQGKEKLALVNSPDSFDRDWYLKNNPDVIESGMDPYEHYQQYGKFEGRFASPPKYDCKEGSVEFDPSRDTVLIVCHEASLTGAPILGLNLAQSLQKKYNVVSLLLDGGSIAENFLDVSVFVAAGTLSFRYDIVSIDNVIEQLIRIYEFKFAIVNSIESRSVLPALAKRFIPIINLIHEFANYTRPREVFPEAVLWSQETIFSASVTHENALFEYPELMDHPFHIIPQGRCILPAVKSDTDSREMEAARVLRGLRPEGLPADTVVILGIGTVQLRKGVDLFIECASRVVQSGHGARCRFVWIGKGYYPEWDVNYSVYIADQIHRSGLQQHVFFMEETSNIEAAYKAADILLISSRLDPLPNVAMDAMMHSLPVICFAKTTGIADILTANNLGEECVIPYLDTAEMAARVNAFIRSKPLREKVGEQLRQLALKEFDMGRYVQQLEGLAQTAIDRIAREQRDIAEIAKSLQPRLDFFLPPHLKNLSRDEAIRYYVRTWASGIYRRKLIPGFHPGIFLEQNGIYESEGDPLVNYLRAGQPAGSWRYDVITSEEIAQPLPPNVRIALHLHVYYPDLLPDILTRLNGNHVQPDLFVSVPTEPVHDEVERILKDYSGKVIEILVVPNCGRDIGPFLTAFGKAFVDRYDIVGHMHTKKTADLQDQEMGNNWRLFLLENLLGGRSNMAAIILGRMATDRSIGMVFPDDPYIVGWGSNRPDAEALGQQLGLSALPEHFLAPVGTMFWARVEALLPIFHLGLGWQDYPVEPLPYDGSILHALERIFPFVAAKQGFRSVLTNVAGSTR